MPYLNLDLDFPDHPKTIRLVNLLGRGSEMCLLRLWAYCGKYHSEDGRFRDYAEEEVEAVGRWAGKPKAMLQAMLKAGWMDRDADGWFMKNWEEHQGHIFALREKGKAMAEARWGRIRAAGNATRNADSNAPTVPSIPPDLSLSPARAREPEKLTDDDLNRWPDSKKPPQNTGRAPIPPERIVSIHNWFCSMTAQQPLNMTVERQWFEFLRLFAEDDFKKVFGYLRKEIRAKQRNAGALKLSNLLQTDKFAEDLALARTNINRPIPAEPKPEKAAAGLPDAQLARQAKALAEEMRKAVE